MPFVNSTLFFGFVYHELKQKKIRCIDAPKDAFTHRNLPESENSKIWKVSILLSRATKHSAVSAFTETVEFLERSLASMLMRYCESMIGCYFFLGIIGSQKRIATYNFHII